MAIDNDSGDELVAILSPRERQMFERAGRVLTKTEVAAESSAATPAVKFHLAHIYGKVGAANGTDVASRYAKAVG